MSGASATGTSWERVGAVPSARLASARLALHWAAQVVAAAGATLLKRRDDWSHTALTWLPDAGALATGPLPGGGRAALRFEPFELFVAGVDGAGPGFALAGRTLGDALAWLGDSLGAGKLVRPEHELPASPLSTGGRFDAADPGARSELGRWFTDATIALGPIAALDGASPIRCWPHHFDVATLLALDPNGAEKGRSIGVGLSPGDASYAEPYWYVTPWPSPEPPVETPVRRGRWHTEGWFGAVLPASALLAAPAEEQASIVAGFLTEALAAGRAMLTPP